MGEGDEKFGVARVREALESKFWPNMQKKEEFSLPSLQTGPISNTFSNPQVASIKRIIRDETEHIFEFIQEYVNEVAMECIYTIRSDSHGGSIRAVPEVNAVVSEASLQPLHRIRRGPV